MRREIRSYTVQYVDSDGDVCVEEFSTRDGATDWLSLLHHLVKAGERLSDIKLIKY